MTRLPALFISHGAPTFALQPGEVGARLTRLGEAIATPRAVLVVSPHWTTRSLSVTSVGRPDTIHDFGGFDPALYRLSYPAPGAPDVAARVGEVLGAAGLRVQADATRGLDHGAWVPLLHLYPAADVPVLQLSMPADLDVESAYALGAALAPLRDEGVLIVGSGSLTHNLMEFRRPVDGTAAEYVRQFAGWARDVVTSNDHERLLRVMELAPHARRAHPTPDHLLPLLIAAGAGGVQDPVTVVEGDVAHGVLAMDSYVFGTFDRSQPAH